MIQHGRSHASGRLQSSADNFESSRRILRAQKIKKCVIFPGVTLSYSYRVLCHHTKFSLNFYPSFQRLKRRFATTKIRVCKKKMTSTCSFVIYERKNGLVTEQVRSSWTSKTEKVHSFMTCFTVSAYKARCALAAITSRKIDTCGFVLARLVEAFVYVCKKRKVACWYYSYLHQRTSNVSQ